MVVIEDVVISHYSLAAVLCEHLNAR
jgi:hypothetical protein